MKMKGKYYAILASSWLLLSYSFAQSKPVIKTLDCAGRVLKIDSVIKNYIIKNAVIEANPFIQIFDTSVVLIGCKAREFSTAWYGAKSSIVDNSIYLQKSTDVCISNGITNLFVADSYSYSQSWKLYYNYSTKYAGFGLNVYGQGDMWNAKTTLTYTGDSFAFGVQRAKGGSVRNLKIVGNYVAPVNNGISYYSTPFPIKQGHRGIVIDYDGSNVKGGSSGYTVEDVCVTGFDVLYCISPAGTDNGDMLRFNHIQCGNGRKGFESNQSQEKGNEINYVSAWGNLQTLIEIGISGKMQAGQYTIRGGNIAGGVVQLFYINLAGWNGFSVEGLTCESIGRLGTVNAWNSIYMPIASIQKLWVRFALKDQAGEQVLFTANSPNVKLINSTLWYYGQPGVMLTSGVFTTENLDLGKSTLTNTQILAK